MAVYGSITSYSSRGRREIPEEDKQVLSALGFDVAAYIGQGIYGSVFSGVCNTIAKKLVSVGPNELRSAPDSTYFDPISRSYVREVCLNGRSCAIKVFHERSRWTDNLYNEAKIMTDLEHPNIIEIYSVCKSNNNIYIIMEYLNGGSLRKFLDSMSLETKLDEFTALQMIRQLTAGLQYLHNQNVVHGDLHGENIMITVVNNNFLSKIVDFGNAKQLQDKNNLNDITNLAFHLTQILDKSLFVRKAIEGNIRAVIQMMRNRVFNDMNQVVEHLSRYLPDSDMPPPPNSFIKRFTKLFSK